MKNCPICGHKVDAYHELTQKEPFIHNNAFDGLNIYGAFSAPKETICFKDNFLHFAFYDSDGNIVDHRLVRLGVESPTTKTPTDEFWEGYNNNISDYFDDEYEEEWKDFDNDDDEYY